MPILWQPLHTTLVLSSVSNIKSAINGDKFANTVCSGFPQASVLSSDSIDKPFLMDGCPE